MLEKLDRMLKLARDINSILKRIESRGKNRHINSVPSDDVKDSKIIEEVDTVNKDNDVEASVEFSLPIPDDTHVHGVVVILNMRQRLILC